MDYNHKVAIRYYKCTIDVFVTCIELGLFWDIDKDLFIDKSVQVYGVILPNKSSMYKYRTVILFPINF